MSGPAGPVLVVSAVPQELSDAPRGGRSSPLRYLPAGIGPGAVEAVRRRLAREKFSLVASTGFAGGVRPGFRVGDLVLATEVVEAGTGRRRKAAAGPAGLNGSCSAGLFVTVERPLRDSVEKREIGLRYGAVAVEMETAGVARAAEEAGVPWVALRAILDPMEAPLPACSAREALGMLLRPGGWGDFMDFWSAIRTASKSLGVGIGNLAAPI